VVKCTGANGTTIRRTAMTRAITVVNIRVAVADAEVAAAVVVVDVAARVVARVVAAVTGARRRFIRRTTAAPLM
jgi:hypothetical protein